MTLPSPPRDVSEIAHVAGWQVGLALALVARGEFPEWLVAVYRLRGADSFEIGLADELDAATGICFRPDVGEAVLVLPHEDAPRVTVILASPPPGETFDLVCTIAYERTDRGIATTAPATKACVDLATVRQFETNLLYGIDERPTEKDVLIETCTLGPYVDRTA